MAQDPRLSMAREYHPRTGCDAFCGAHDPGVRSVLRADFQQFDFGQPADHQLVPLGIGESRNIAASRLRRAFVHRQAKRHLPPPRQFERMETPRRLVPHAQFDQRETALQRGQLRDIRA